MKTKLMYLENSYQKTASAKVLEVIDASKQTYLILDQTIFYAQGGGQPADHGSIVGSNGELKVTHVSYNGGAILHLGDLTGYLSVGEEVQLSIDWDRRYNLMQLHTAGHILDQGVKNVIPGIMGVDGNHGLSKYNFVEFNQKITREHLAAIQNAVNEIVAADLKITAEMVTYEQLLEREVRLPFDLPKNKDLRIVQIGEYPPMPDGGTQLQSTGESWPIKVNDVIEKDSKWRVTYTVAQSADKKTDSGESSQPSKKESFAMQLDELKEKIAQVKKQVTEEVGSAVEIKTKYLGKKGIFNDIAKAISQVSVDAKREAGQLLNELKTELETTITQLSKKSVGPQGKIDLTIPGIKPNVGHMHPISQAMEEITHIFEKVGFTRVRYPEVDWDWYVFESLNMPPNHPARDEWETFFVDAPADSKKGSMVLTTHTSNGQVREMERLKSQPPIRMINIARCYRRQQDATHTQMFHQFEGLVVDKGITIQHLKGTLDYFAKEFYGPDVKSRIRPFHFRFTEPSFEVDFSCHICHGTGYLDKTHETKCKFCKSGWHEVGGAGMVHPNVLKAGGINPEEYTGFAFGWGVERTYTLKEGLNIDDIRLLYSGDLRFLEQF